jgi:DNA-binding MarR family transcriptional regulator
VRPPSYGTDAMALEQQVSFALSVVHRQVLAIYRPLLAELHLTHPQYLVMLALWQYGPLTVRRLGHLLQLDSGTLSPLLKRLERLGHLHRKRDQADERSVIIELTDSGNALRKRAESVPPAVLRGLGLPAEDVEHLQSVLAGVLAAARPAAA